MNTNVDDYSIADLFAILNITTQDPSVFQITDKANNLVAQLKSENKLELAVFVEEARDKIITELEKQPFYDEEEDVVETAEPDITVAEQERNLWQNQYPEQSNETERTKPTDRKQKIEIFDKDATQNNAFVMNRQRLGVLQSHPIPVVQGTINPNLKNTMRRLISIDSQYRSNIIPYSNNSITSPSFNTDFSFDLSERITNVLSIRLNSIQIPTTWYIFDDTLSNTCFIYAVGANLATATQTSVTIPPGNYTLNYLNTFFANQTLDLKISVDEITGRIIFSSNTVDVTLIFYDAAFFIACANANCSNLQMKINQNFGWTLGYRTRDETRLLTSLNTTTTPLPQNTLANYSIAQAAPNIYGPAYFLLVVDDYNNNRVNNTLVTNINVSNKLDLPSYYNSAIKNANNTFATAGCESPLPLNLPPVPPNAPQLLPYMLPSAPRQLTQSQLYSANEILYNRSIYSNKTVGPSTADVLALIPLNGIGNLRAKVFYDTTGAVSASDSQQSQPYILFGNQLEGSDRTYFGPVNLERMRVRLLDDKGNLVNLNDADWSFSLLVEQLYQY